MQSAASIWEYLKKEYRGNEIVLNMQVMNLIREFEMKKMKESETIKDYSDQLLDIANKVDCLVRNLMMKELFKKFLQHCLRNMKPQSLL